MENPRPEKVAVVTEVRHRFESAGATLLTEYRGINVAAMAELRRAIVAAGGRYKVYKNTLVRFAANEAGLEIDEWLTGPTAIAFIEDDPVAVAKALRDFARTNPALVVKGGLLGTTRLSAEDARALADIAPRDELLARLAGAMAAPMQQFAGLLQAVPRSFAYGLQALIDAGGAAGAPDATPEPEPETEPEPEMETETETETEAELATETESTPGMSTETLPERDAADRGEVAPEAPEAPEAVTTDPEARSGSDAAAVVNHPDGETGPETNPETHSEHEASTSAADDNAAADDAATSEES